MPISLQRSGLTGRKSFLDQLSRKPIADLIASVAPRQETPAPEVAPVPEISETPARRSIAEGDTSTSLRDPIGYTGEFGELYGGKGPPQPEYPDNILGRMAKDLESPMTLASYGLSLAGGGPVGLGMRAGTHLATRAVKDYIAPFVKEKVLEPLGIGGEADRGGDISERGGSWGEDVGMQGGFDPSTGEVEAVSERGGSWGEDVGGQGGFDDIGASEDEDDGWF